ncbi:hypothetical protein FRX31_024950 [Thalictrum thalictroides]|uniref:Uncharacterized protein n=1 Tax=Thalictrum thalictroides TaxID=46969 RepID=A0A7J6VMA3_THATH|nr:hypothetical protein FRX31_024950 [Thalictrum thalictroides]
MCLAIPSVIFNLFSPKLSSWHIKLQSLCNTETLLYNTKYTTSMATDFIKATVWQCFVWQWMNMLTKAMQLREKVSFQELLHGWRLVMVEQW